MPRHMRMPEPEAEPTSFKEHFVRYVYDVTKDAKVRAGLFVGGLATAELVLWTEPPLPKPVFAIITAAGTVTSVFAGLRTLDEFFHPSPLTYEECQEMLAKQQKPSVAAITPPQYPETPPLAEGSN